MLNLDLNKANMDWDNWKNYLKHAVEFATELGVPKDKIQALAEQAGYVLAENVPPANNEQKAVKELWEVADDSEKKVIASLMTKLVSK
ncbi:MAG: DUF3243 domain-containing protein [Clostridiales bacterium]|nr:DUF3243 domain-containing protein [Clostridiales bacterium]MCF8021161.1 DUF3243 domain-containing protein [Clostridiales bacterium]